MEKSTQNREESRDYKAQSIQVLADVRTKLDLDSVAEILSQRGDISKFSEKHSINYSALKRGLEEHKILGIFPSLDKCKAPILARIRNNRELQMFSKKYDIFNLKARQLLKVVRFWRKELENDPKLLLTPLQHDLIIGSTIGDAFIRKRERNSCFRVGHTKKQEKYLRFKYSIFKEFCITEPSWNTRVIKKKNTVRTLEMATATHYVFNYYQKLFYRNGRKIITQDILNLLNPRSLAFWICDDGSYSNNQGYIILCTNSFSLEEHKIMKRYFNEVWNLNPTIGFRDRKYYYLRFKQEDSKKLVEIVKKFIPKSMKYKIGEENE